MNKQNKSIILFDGVCNLCNTSVNFVLKNDKSNHFKFASLQSDVAKQLLLHQNANISNKYIDSIVLISNNTIFTKSTAALNIARKLRFPLNFSVILFIFPKFIRDYIYDIIARNRYKWFGKKAICRVPSKEELDKFLI